MTEALAETLATAAIAGGGILAFLMLSLFFVKTFLVIGRPNQLLVFSGRENTLDDGTKVGWHYIAGGRRLRIPLLERVDGMDLTTMPIDIKIRGAYAKGNIPVSVDAVANAKITLQEPLVHHAIERFLGKHQREIRQVAKETLEGTLRGVLAQLTPEEINHDRQKLSDVLKSEVADDLSKLGLMVDTFKIQHVADDVNYLDSISRVRIAEVIRDAEIAESDANREAEESIATARSRGRVAEEQAQAQIAEKENELARITAELDATARSEEERTTGAALEARATAEQELQKVRQVVEQLRLQADNVIPAELEALAQQLRAAGDAAIRSETGHAQADALSALHGAWATAGDRAREVVLIQQIDHILADVAKVTEGLTVDHVNIIDSGDGSSLASYVGSYPAVVTEILERIKHTVGIDVTDILSGQPSSDSDKREV